MNRYPVPTIPRVKAVLIRTCYIDLRASADAMKAITDLQSGSRPRAILKIRPPSSLDYRARHGPQTRTIPHFIPLNKSNLPLQMQIFSRIDTFRAIKQNKCELFFKRERSSLHASRFHFFFSGTDIYFLLFS